MSSSTIKIVKDTHSSYGECFWLEIVNNNDETIRYRMSENTYSYDNPILFNALGDTFLLYNNWGTYITKVVDDGNFLLDTTGLGQLDGTHIQSSLFHDKIKYIGHLEILFM